MSVNQDPSEEVRQCLASVQREHVSDMLVGADDDDTAGVPIDPAQVEDVLGRWVWAEDLLVVGDAEGTLRGSRTVGSWSTSRSLCPCWTMARTSITESGRRPWGCSG